MDGRSLVRDWDAIMAVNAERVNQLWKQQYESRSNAGFRKRIVTNRAMTLDTRFSKLETRCILEVGSPKIQFVRNNQNKVFISNVIIELVVNIESIFNASTTIELTLRL